ncbi:coiled-coil-helix-coiled-coil-helix domain-containing protein 1 [Polypterus senegalus]|uniref:coiled-coil-helix-coiled-coil-helix domain-containing protein 1 n=1 Tax=Polypterus senegalus TaxID=55291 RepID=UPI0019658DD0|nr:coiled-coil-helix-coiled-coil-helix domain-containing protein 1 [Polypterus senegalus]
MAAQGGSSRVFDKVANLLNRENKKPVLKPNKPLVLQDRVAERRPRRGEVECITEMSVMMACWKQNNFSNAVCASEVQSFLQCTAQAEAKRKADLEQQRKEQGGRLLPKQANKLLKKYPNILSEI